MGLFQPHIGFYELISFGERNSFADNSAVNGGGIYIMSDSRLTLNGCSQFLTNKCASTSLREMMSLYNYYSNHEEEFNNTWGRCGGALFMDNGYLTIQGNASFTLNTADGEGGAMQLNYTSSNISGNL